MTNGLIKQIRKYMIQENMICDRKRQTDDRVKKLKCGAAYSLRHSSMPCLGGVKTLLMMLLMLTARGMGEGCSLNF